MIRLSRQIFRPFPIILWAAETVASVHAENLTYTDLTHRMIDLQRMDFATCAQDDIKLVPVP